VKPGVVISNIWSELNKACYINYRSKTHVQQKQKLSVHPGITHIIRKAMFSKIDKFWNDHPKQETEEGKPK